MDSPEMPGPGYDAQTRPLDRSRDPKDGWYAGPGGWFYPPLEDVEAGASEDWHAIAMRLQADLDECDERARKRHLIPALGVLVALCALAFIGGVLVGASA